jgi:hypothetical protein
MHARSVMRVGDARQVRRSMPNLCAQACVTHHATMLRMARAKLTIGIAPDPSVERAC